MRTIDESDVPPLLRLASGGQFAKALAVAARLGLADLTGDSPVPVAELARATGTRPDVLGELLRTLAFVGVFEPGPADHFRLAAAFAPLRADHPHSLRNFCVLQAGLYTDAFNGLQATVATGSSGFREVFGTELYPYLAAHPGTEGLFDAAMAELCRPTAAALAAGYDFRGVRDVVDVGGGDGTLLAALLAAQPALRGVCVDRPSVCRRAAGAHHPAADRLTFRPADIFDELPVTGDRFLLKNVLHDWSAASQSRLLASVRAALVRTAGARLLVLEPLFDQEHGPAHALAQRVVCADGARPFLADELRGVLAGAGLPVLDSRQLACGHHLFECAPSD
ncbi:methyltransferase [Streptomyces sp. DSM 44915]|uniref:Methyltransferase n=1 Tax=Streptomyces chisholmiae TaxID=3075540 RepID=A0ABU2JQY0_9ACTN|nr:methyltransferase [Streptomyces sp. DSM 44915]MDT0267387.1 methyltransferase [Streptomyces sp. DSM 44915]